MTENGYDTDAVTTNGGVVNPFRAKSTNFHAHRDIFESQVKLKGNAHWPTQVGKPKKGSSKYSI